VRCVQMLGRLPFLDSLLKHIQKSSPTKSANILANITIHRLGSALLTGVMLLMNVSQRGPNSANMALR
jgi:hypothetical protein